MRKPGRSACRARRSTSYRWLASFTPSMSMLLSGRSIPAERARGEARMALAARPATPKLEAKAADRRPREEAERMRAFGRIVVGALTLAALMALPATAQGPDCIVIDDFSKSTVGQFPTEWKARTDEGLGVYA